MTILEFRSENVRKLSVVEIKPTEKGLVLITGKNGQGKSSCLDTIEMVLAGADHIPVKPVRRGQDKAVGELGLGDANGVQFTVKRTVTKEGGGSLIVRNKDGVKMDSPQKLLDTLYGKLSFDPLDFARQKPDKRSEILRALVGLDFSKQDSDYALLYSTRTEVNRVAKAKEAMLKSNPRYADMPKEEQSTAAIADVHAAAITQNKINEEKRRGAQIAHIEAEHAANRVKAGAERVASLELQIERLQAELDAQRQGLSRCQGQYDLAAKSARDKTSEIEQLKDVDVSQFATQLSELEKTNAKVRKNKQVDAIAEEFKAKTKESEAITKKLEAIESAKREAIATAKFPVPGLGLSDTNEVTFNGMPFDSASTAEQLKISVAMGLALNPKLKVLLIRQGNDLDTDNLKLIGQMAETAGAQIWLERVSSNGEVSVIIEDGHVAEATT